MNKLVVLCLFASAFMGAFAHPISEDFSYTNRHRLDNKGTIEGIVIDAKLNETLPYVTIIVETLNGETQTGGITDSKGKFKVNSLADGTYRITIQYIGFKPYEKGNCD